MIKKMKHEVELMLHFNNCALVLFDEGKFLRAAREANLRCPHEQAKRLKELSSLILREEKRLLKEGREKGAVKHKKSTPQYRRMIAAYMRWYNNKTPERRAEYEAARQVWKVELKVSVGREEE